MKKWLLALAMTWVCSSEAWAQGTDTPMHFSQKFTGDQSLRFSNGGRSLQPSKAKLQYRLISNAKEWKSVWGYLYDDTVKVDFKNQVVLAVYKSPANGAYDIVPRRVQNVEGKLHVDVDVVFTGKTTRSHPFLFLVVKNFKKLGVSENFIAPAGKAVRYP